MHPQRTRRHEHNGDPQQWKGGMICVASSGSDGWLWRGYALALLVGVLQWQIPRAVKSRPPWTTHKSTMGDPRPRGRQHLLQHG